MNSIQNLQVRACELHPEPSRDPVNSIQKLQNLQVRASELHPELHPEEEQAGVPLIACNSSAEEEQAGVPLITCNSSAEEEQAGVPLIAYNSSAEEQAGVPLIACNSSGEEEQAGGAPTPGRGAHTAEEPASRTQGKRATYQDFLNIHVIWPSLVPNTSWDWTQLMRERRIFGRPVNTFIHREQEQILRAFSLGDRTLQYWDAVGLVHWSKALLSTTNLQLRKEEYSMEHRALMMYVALAFVNGLPVLLGRVASKRPAALNANKLFSSRF
ncbi:UNVERIFIED_CONTAM: hypothetical protein FKN15_045070 [Acipenser sinensis]